MRALLSKIKETLRVDGGSASIGDLIQRLNQQIRGWTLYHRHASSKRTYYKVDDRIYHLVWRLLRRRHRKKGGKWIKKKYFCYHQGRSWVLHGKCYRKDGDVYSVYLMKASSMGIRRHSSIQKNANPYDPAWETYFEKRFQEKMSGTLGGKSTIRLLWEEQQGKCVHCGQPLSADDYQVHPRHWRVYGGGDEITNLDLVHGNCHRPIHWIL